MAGYMLDRSGLADAKRILFIDQQLPNRADYLSALTAIGLKQRLASGCVLAWEVPYLYSDFTAATGAIYGRGFGYSRVLSPASRGPRFRFSRSDLGSFDGLVIGSIARNGPLAFRLLDRFPADRTVWIHGEDQPPSQREFYFMRESGTHLFVRAVPS
jgi:hypothetical protein